MGVTVVAAEGARLLLYGFLPGQQKEHGGDGRAWPFNDRVFVMVYPCFHTFGAQRLKTSQRFAEVPRLPSAYARKNRELNVSRNRRAARAFLSLCEQLDSLRLLIKVPLDRAEIAERQAGSVAD
jgi:hypothetical protein